MFRHLWKKTALMTALLLAMLFAMACAQAEGVTVTFFAFEDQNNNGTKGTYEEMAAGVEVSLCLEDGTVVQSGVTDRKGEASMEGVPEGMYVVKTLAPEGYGYGEKGTRNASGHSIMTNSVEREQISAAVEIKGKTVELGIGVMRLCEVKGLVWMDDNCDGIRQDEEGGQSGVVITLTGTKNGLVYETVTDETGAFSIKQIKNGSYDMRYTLPEGTVLTRYSATGGDRRSILTQEGASSVVDAIILDVAEVMDTCHVGVMRQATFTGVCFLDANGNGFYDEEDLPLPGVKLTAIRQTTGNEIAQTYSGEDGRFVLPRLRAGIFKVKALLPVGMAYTAVTEDPAGNQFAARPGRREQTVTDIRITDGANVSFVVGAVEHGSISGNVYFDDNFTAIREDGEKAANGFAVQLLDASGKKVASVETNKSGAYTFDSLIPGDYTISVTARAGYAFTKKGEGNVIINRGAGEGASAPITLHLGEHITGQDIGMILPGRISGTVFADENDNGVMDAGEDGLAGTLVRLMGEEGEYFSAFIGEDGQFLFDAVMPGRYYLRYELPEKSIFARVKPQGNTISGDETIGTGIWFDFTTGSEMTAPLCGGMKLGEITGVAFADENGNAAMDAQEAFLPGVVLTLTPVRDDVAAIQVVTREDGAFALTGLRPGQWTLEVQYPDGYVSSRMSSVTLPLKHGVSLQTANMTIDMGQCWLDQPLGGSIPASLKGQVWLDENNNGVMEDGEQTPAGETITIIDQTNGSVFAVLTTDEEGVFATEGLVPGSFDVVYELDSRHIAPKSGDTTFTEGEGCMEVRSISVTQGDEVQGLTLGLVRLSSMDGKAWVDDGTQVTALPNVAVTLTDMDGNTLQETVTDETGAYAFNGLLPGMYAVKARMPKGIVVVEQTDVRLTQDGNESILTTVSGDEGASDGFQVVMAYDLTGLNIGGVSPAVVGDLCWLDENNNGLQDMGEGGIPGVEITLLRDGVAVQSTVSDQYGFYRFENVYPAEYTLLVHWPLAVKPGQVRTDFPMIVSVLEEDGTTAPFTVDSASRHYDADLGFVLVKKGVYPDGYGEGATQFWNVQH